MGAMESEEFKAVASEEVSPSKPSKPSRGEDATSPVVSRISSSVLSKGGAGGDDRTGSGFAIAEELASLRRTVEEGNTKLREEIAALRTELAGRTTGASAVAGTVSAGTSRRQNSGKGASSATSKGQSQTAGAAKEED